MKLVTDLLASCPGVLRTRGEAGVSVGGITSDSRAVKPGDLFVAIAGVKTDGAKFIADAVAKGAAVIVTEQAADAPCVIEVKNARLALSYLASAFYEGQPEYTVAVTGTDGKSSTADLFRQLCQLSGVKAASIGTLGVIGGQKDFPALHTTPDPVALHHALSELAKEGVTHLALEASSHGLEQHRLDGVKLKAAAFTNLTRDHLDYHGTVENYFAAKLRLFGDLLEPGGTAVINADDARAGEIIKVCEARGCRVRTYGMKGLDYRIESIQATEDGLTIDTYLLGEKTILRLPLAGRFQAFNLMAAIGLAQVCGIEIAALRENIPKLAAVPGRMEKAANHPSGAPIFVDYAHTPAALSGMLAATRPHVPGRLVVVFGCGGDRDKGKRPEMGKAAVEHADLAVLADDNPRSENPETIRKEILAGIPSAKHNLVKNVGDRREAIAFAIASLNKGDGLLVAGKGHEKMQIIGNQTVPFDDVAVAREIVASLQGTKRKNA